MLLSLVERHLAPRLWTTQKLP